MTEIKKTGGNGVDKDTPEGAKKIQEQEFNFKALFDEIKKEEQKLHQHNERDENGDFNTEKFSLFDSTKAAGVGITAAVIAAASNEKYRTTVEVSEIYKEKPGDEAIGLNNEANALGYFVFAGAYLGLKMRKGFLYGVDKMKEESKDNFVKASAFAYTVAKSVKEALDAMKIKERIDNIKSKIAPEKSAKKPSAQEKFGAWLGKVFYSGGERK